MKRRILSMLLVLMMLFTIMPTAAFAEETADGVTYSYADGVLTVSGTGTVNYQWRNYVPYYNDDYSVTKIVIQDGITAIDSYTFYECVELESVEIAETVTEIGDGAFQGCTNLKSINIPSGVERINSYTFTNCSSLKSITIPNGVTTIEIAFSGCTSLTAINIPASVSEIYSDAFSGCTSLESITVDSGNTVFYANDGILFRKYWNEETPNEYFVGLYRYPAGKKAAEYTVPDNVAIICCDAFESCDSINTINIGANLSDAESGAFYGCNNLTNINVDDGNTHFIFKNNVLYSCKPIVSEGGTLDRLEIDGIERCLPCYEGAFTIPEGVTHVPTAAFAGCTKLTEVALPESLTGIANSAFENCSALTEITVSGNVEYIGEYAFRNCVNLKKAVLEDGIDYIYFGAFEGCEKLERVTLPSNITEIYSSTFKDCKSLTEITIPVGVTHIDYEAFVNCTALTSITIPESVKSIDAGAFSGCSGLTEVTIPATVESWGGNVFQKCTNLRSVEIEDGVNSISSYMFMGCEKLENFTLPSTIKKIGQGAFSGCTTLTDVVIPDGVTDIEYATFADCSSLKNITIPASVTVIDDMMIFNDDEFENVYFGGSREQWQEAIGENNVLNFFPTVVFHYNYVAGQDHTVTNGVCSCGAYSAEHTHVYGDDNLCKYCGEKNPNAHEHDFLHGTVGTDDNGTYLTCAVKDCTARSYARVETGKCGDNVTYTWTKFDVPGFDTLVISGKGDMWDWGEVSPRWLGIPTTVIVEEGITRVGDMAIKDALMGDNLLTTVQLPSTLKSIGSYAFSYNENLKSIKLPDGLETIEVGAFQACNSLTSVTIPASVKSIQFAAFSALPIDKLSKVYSLTQYNVDRNNANYKSVDGVLYTEDGEDGLTLVNYPAARTNTKITVPDGTAKLSDWAFRGNANVETIVLPASITDIQMGAFYRCDSLKTILFNGTEAQWKEACKDTENIKAEVVCLGDESGKTVSDDETTPTVTVKGYDNVIDTVDTVTIKEATYEDAKSIIENSNIVLISGDSVKAYDIKLKDSKNNEVQPGGYVQVKLKVPAGYEGSKCVVYHQNEYGTLTPMDAVLDGEYLVFITDSFSNYIIYQQHEHILGDAVTVRKATCTEPGYTEKTCTVEGCNYVRKTEIPATGHNAPLTGAKDATCTEDGSTGKRICKTCNAILQIDQVIKAPGSHDYVNGTCTVCGASKPSAPVVHTHTVVIDPEVAATCTKTGLTEGKHCSVCNAIIVAQKETPALGHTEVVDPAVAATCEKTGLTEGKHCSVCNEVLVAQKETPKTEHKFENGKCSVCGAADPDYVAPVVNPFKDVKEGDAFYDEILWAADKGIIKGDGTGNYNPNDGITRAQIVMILWNAAGNKEASKPSGFADVKEDAWYAKAVAWAVENGITNGTDLGFEPDRVCTRAEIVTFLHRANNKPAPAAAASFTDLTQDWYKDAVAWAVENGITKGVGDNRFAPNDTCTRGQAAAFMYRLAQLAK